MTLKFLFVPTTVTISSRHCMKYAFSQAVLKQLKSHYCLGSDFGQYHSGISLEDQDKHIF